MKTKDRKKKNTIFNADIKACNFPIGLLSLFLKKEKKNANANIKYSFRNFFGASNDIRPFCTLC